MDEKVEADLAVAFMDAGDVKKIVAWLDARSRAFDDTGRKFTAIIVRQLARDLLKTSE